MRIIPLIDLLECDVRWMYKNIRGSQLKSLFRSYKAITEDEWVSLMEGAEGWVGVDEDTLSPLICCWLSDIVGDARANIHVFLFKEGYGNSDIGREMLSFIHSLGYSCLIGYIPKDNILCQRYVANVGMSYVGILPKAIYDAKLEAYIDATVWYSVKEK